MKAAAEKEREALERLNKITKIEDRDERMKALIEKME
jgi:hypothetical protein